MKITKMSFIVVFLITICSTTAFSADTTTTNTTAGEPLELTGLTISVSSGVNANYFVEGSAPIQWYAVSTSHADGTRAYGTAQNSTSIYYQDDVAAADVSFPASTAANSDTAWSSDSWDR